MTKEFDSHRDRKDEFAAVFPTSIDYTSQGTQAHFEIVGTSKEALDATADLLGLKPVSGTDKNSRSVGISDWSKCKWEPQGPNLSWKNPTKN